MLNTTCFFFPLSVFYLRQHFTLNFIQKNEILKNNVAHLYACDKFEINTQMKIVFLGHVLKYVFNVLFQLPDKQQPIIKFIPI